MKAQLHSQLNYPFCLLACADGLLAVPSLASAQLWQQAALPTATQYRGDTWRWPGLAASADFTTLFAAGYPCDPEIGCQSTPLYVSHDLGRTLVPTGPPLLLGPIACSADGTKLMAASGYALAGSLLTSADAGSTWVQGTGPTNGCSVIVCSADGVKGFAACDGSVYASTDSGITWNATAAPQNDWVALACSADGSKVFAAASLDNYAGGGDGTVHASTNSGATWGPTAAPTNQWRSIACSAGGAVVVAQSDDGVWLSKDSGRTWANSFTPLNAGYGVKGVVCSAEGTRLAAALGDDVYVSTNSGANWAASPPLGVDVKVSSADGNRLLGVTESGELSLISVFTAPYTGPWRLADWPADWQDLEIGLVCAALSTDGTKLVASGPAIYSSPDSGNTWLEHSNIWLAAVTSSADGARLAGAADDQIYTSADSGATWLPTTAYATTPSNVFWQAIASSYDGVKLVAVGTGTTNGFINTSLDSGATWRLANAPSSLWASVASSADGTRLAAAGDAGIYLSPDSGVTWQLSAPPNGWTSIASSTNGTHLFAATGVGGLGSTNDGIYASADTGTTWHRTSASTNYGWQSISCSADGTKVVAIGGQTFPGTSVWESAAEVIFISTDSGLTWASAEAPAGDWGAVACSGDGSNVVAVAHNGEICTLHLPLPPPPAFVPPTLSIAQSGSEFRLSWLVPSSSFQLQENLDLSTTNWSDVSANPALNSTNLHYEVNVSSSSGSHFYRLKQQ